MKLFVFCLFAVCLCSLATDIARDKITREKRKLRELLHQLTEFKNSLQPTQRNIELHTPPLIIEDCCSLRALDCFRANLAVHFNLNEDDKLIRSLKNSHTKKGLTFLGRTNATSPCSECDSHPKERVDEFLKRLVSLVQKGINW